MDFKKLIPDFSAFGRTNWGKPSIKTGDKNWLISAILVALMVIFVFLPWCSVSTIGVSGSRLGITTWYGIIGLIAALVALYGVLYEQKQFVFCGAALGVLFGLLGIFLWSDIEINTTIMGQTINQKVTKDMVENNPLVSVGHIGAILYMISALCAAGWSFLQIKNEK